MGTSYEHFVACLRTAASRRLIGVTMSDEEALALAADGDACRAFFEVWSAATPAAAPGAQLGPDAVPERVLLDITTVGRGATPARVLVTTHRLVMSTESGSSGWKMLLGVATLGVSTAATGLNAGRAGELNVPIRAATAAFITKSGLAYSTVTIIVGGEALGFGIASTASQAVAGSINAAIAGGLRSDAAVNAWDLYAQGRVGLGPRENDLRKQLKRQEISKSQFDYGIAVAHALHHLVTI